MTPRSPKKIIMSPIKVRKKLPVSSSYYPNAFPRVTTLPSYDRPSPNRERIYSTEPITDIPHVVHPENLSPRKKKEYEKMIRGVEKYWIEADKSNYPQVFKSDRKKPRFEVDGKQWEVVEHSPGREYMLGPRGEKLDVPPEIAAQIRDREEPVKRRHPKLEHRPPKRPYYDSVHRMRGNKENNPRLSNMRIHISPSKMSPPREAPQYTAPVQEYGFSPPRQTPQEYVMMQPVE
jgi:hypothetical protein